MNDSKLNFKRKDLYRMKGLIVNTKIRYVRLVFLSVEHFLLLMLLGIVVHIGALEV